MKQLLNEQVNKEFTSAYTCIWIFRIFIKAKAWTVLPTGTMQAQKSATTPCCSQYLQNNNVRVTLDAIAKPNVPWTL